MRKYYIIHKTRNDAWTLDKDGIFVDMLLLHPKPKGDIKETIEGIGALQAWQIPDWAKNIPKDEFTVYVLE